MSEQEVLRILANIQRLDHREYWTKKEETKLPLHVLSTFAMVAGVRAMSEGRELNNYLGW